MNKNQFLGSSLIEDNIQPKKKELDEELNQALINQLMDEDENDLLAQ